jgi:hypothetical protein
MSQVSQFQPIFQSLLPIPNTEIFSFYQFSVDIAQQFPEILESIKLDRDKYALNKKEMRSAVARYNQSQYPLQMMPYFFY